MTATRRFARPDPEPEVYLANAKRLERLVETASDDTNRDFLLEKLEEQYLHAITALDDRQRSREAIQIRAALTRVRSQSGRRHLHTDPLLAEHSAFRRYFNSLSASDRVGRFFNGTDDVDDVVNLARKWMTRRERLVAAEGAATAATCMLWRGGREADAIQLYDDFTNFYVVDILEKLSLGQSLHLAEHRAAIASQRLLLTGRKHEARQLLDIVSEALQATG